MITVKDIMSIIADAKEVRLGYDGVLIPFDHKDKIMGEAYGKYVVESLYSLGEDCFEIKIAMRPVVAE